MNQEKKGQGKKDVCHFSIANNHELRIGILGF